MGALGVIEDAILLERRAHVVLPEGWWSLSFARHRWGGAETEDELPHGGVTFASIPNQRLRNNPTHILNCNTSKTS